MLAEVAAADKEAQAVRTPPEVVVAQAETMSLFGCRSIRDNKFPSQWALEVLEVRVEPRAAVLEQTDPPEVTLR